MGKITPSKWAWGHTEGHILHNTLLREAKLPCKPRTLHFRSQLPPTAQTSSQSHMFLRGGCSRTEATADGWKTACLTNRWKKPKGPEQKILLPLRDRTGFPINMPFVPGSKDSTNHLPELHSTLFPHCPLLSSPACKSMLQWASQVNKYQLHPLTRHLSLSCLLLALQVWQESGILALVQILQW